MKDKELNDFLKSKLKMKGIKYSVEDNRIIITAPKNTMLFPFEFEIQLNEIRQIKYIEVRYEDNKLFRIYHSNVESIQIKYNLNLN